MNAMDYLALAFSRLLDEDALGQSTDDKMSVNSNGLFMLVWLGSPLRFCCSRALRLQLLALVNFVPVIFK